MGDGGYKSCKGQRCLLWSATRNQQYRQDFGREEGAVELDPLLNQGRVRFLINSPHLSPLLIKERRNSFPDLSTVCLCCNIYSCCIIVGTLKCRNTFLSVLII